MISYAIYLVLANHPLLVDPPPNPQNRIPQMSAWESELTAEVLSLSALMLSSLRHFILPWASSSIYLFLVASGRSFPALTSITKSTVAKKASSTFSDIASTSLVLCSCDTTQPGSFPVLFLSLSQLHDFQATLVSQNLLLPPWGSY